MSNRPDIPCSEEMREYYEGIPAHWPEMPAVCPYAPPIQEIVCFRNMS